MQIIEILQTHAGYYLFAAALLGLTVGSFLNVVILRLPVMMEREWDEQCREHLASHESGHESGHPPAQPIAVDQAERFNLVSPRSRCPRCGHAISALENIPVVSWLLLKGRCRDCGTRISARYPLIELLTGTMTALVAWHFGFTLQAGMAMLLTWALIALSFIDIDKMLLPDSIVLPFLWLGLLLSLEGVFVTPSTAIIGAAAGYLSLWSVFHAFRLLTGKEGMGYGDFKLLALFGAWLGWQMLPLIILLSSAVGAIIGVSLVIFRGRDRTLPIPFGPYLAVAGWLALLWGQPMLNAYLDWAARISP